MPKSKVWKNAWFPVYLVISGSIGMKTMQFRVMTLILKALVCLTVFVVRQINKASKNLMKYYTKLISLLFFLNICLLPVFSYDRHVPEKKQSGDVGIGAGIDYGGFGIQLNQFFWPICLVGGYGYNNVYFLPFGGVKYYFSTIQNKIKYALYIKVIYGYNAVIIIKDGPKDFYCGFTPGIGTDIRFGKKKWYGLNFDLNFPVRTKKYKRDYDNFKITYSNFNQTTLPIAISIGIQFSLD